MSESQSNQPLLRLRDVCRVYGHDETAIIVLNEVNLDIRAGEMVAIVGASGSGKSTLMNILGCLDEPSSGAYLVEGEVTSALHPDELARLRREHFGFVFQRYQLIGALSAAENVETPAVYVGTPRAERRERATAILGRLGLSERLDHKPSALSGGQQQRVSVARSLMNGGKVILADEPTGALDSHSGKELMQLLDELNAEGHTIILVTHDMAVAHQARRIIEISDGRIVADYENVRDEISSRTPSTRMSRLSFPTRTRLWDGYGDAFNLALKAASHHPLRTFLTMLGIIIGIASVVCVVALGNGSRDRVLKNIQDFGTNTLEIYPGARAGDLRAGMFRGLSLADVEALAEQPFVDAISPMVSTSTTLRYRDIAVSADVQGVDVTWFRVRGISVVEGVTFNERSVATQAQDAVIDKKTQETLFGDEPAVGSVILAGNILVRVVGVISNPDEGRTNGRLSIWLPYTSVMGRMTGRYSVQSATVRLPEGTSSTAAIDAVTSLLERRHGARDFNTFSSDALRELVTRTSDELSLLISAIAFISLLVGGIGVMNIMLVSVSERVHEIGIRMAVGARQADIRNQFLIEAVLICLFGGAAGVLLALAVGAGVSTPDGRYVMRFSTVSIVTAFVSATVIGVVFGFMPAQRAARMNPAEALARE